MVQQRRAVLESYKYDFDENGCRTGSHSYSSKGDYCDALRDDAANNYCAKAVREETYRRECG